MSEGAHGTIYPVIYVEVMPPRRGEAVALLERYREATRARDGSLRCEVVSRIGQPHQLAVLEAWRDQAAFEAYAAASSRAGFLDGIQAIRNAPTDERLHVGISVGPLEADPGAEAIWVVTHVDVIPPRKDDGRAALEQLAGPSRAAPGNLRFEVLQQTTRPNHFTVIEVWRDTRAVEAHSMAEATLRFRDALAPMSGALYDERLYAFLGYSPGGPR